jgi:hypothetical protein
MENFSGRVGFIFFMSMLLSLVCIISSAMIVLYYLHTLILIFFIISMIVCAVACPHICEMYAFLLCQWLI